MKKIILCLAFLFMDGAFAQVNPKAFPKEVVTQHQQELEIDGTQILNGGLISIDANGFDNNLSPADDTLQKFAQAINLPLIHISEPTRPY